MMRRPRHQCDVPGCPVMVEPWQRLCTAHFRALPPMIRASLIAARRTMRIADWNGWRAQAAAWLADHPPPDAAAAYAHTARRMGEKE